MLPFKMAEDAEMKTPSSVNTEEADDLTTATVKMEIPGFQVQSGIFAKPKPKAGKSNADVKYESMSLELSADVTAGSKTTKYFYKVNKLPGEIDPDKSTVEYKKGMIILKMVKRDLTSWAVMLRNGLDQAPDDSPEN
ncbi:uncharacterized protein LOC128230529 [Mya arenaria]|uniref:uncharacterized protein LOC128230529 n=1 Tax=Mya arenaria TaxID=6604 RepID=UPI0022E1CE3D|nr:uncharacterized protein LOC128230529 [Mya arenaria]